MDAYDLNPERTIGPLGLPSYMFRACSFIKVGNTFRERFEFFRAAHCDKARHLMMLPALKRFQLVQSSFPLFEHLAIGTIFFGSVDFSCYQPVLRHAPLFPGPFVEQRCDLWL